MGDAEQWLIEATWEKTLLRFLCYIQDRPMPDAESEFWGRVESPEDYRADTAGHRPRAHDQLFWEEADGKVEA